MAEEKAPGTEATKTGGQANSQPQGGGGGSGGKFPDILKTLLGAVGLFTILCYLLGRLYIEYYYSKIGIAPGVLKFDTNDYMFFSVSLVIMCLVFSGCLFAYWWWFKPGNISGKTRLISIIGLIIIIASITYLIYLAFVLSQNRTPVYDQGMAGLLFGLAYGLLPCLYAMEVKTLLNEKPNVKPDVKPNEKPEGKPYAEVAEKLILAAFAVFLVISLPYIAQIFAEAQATNDMKKAPVVMAVCTKEFPAQLQGPSPFEKNSLIGTMVITNNGMTYVLVKDALVNTALVNDEATRNELEKAAWEEAARATPPSKPKPTTTPTANVTNWRVYAIPVGSIQYILYLPSGTSIGTENNTSTNSTSEPDTSAP